MIQQGILHLKSCFQFKLKVGSIAMKSLTITWIIETSGGHWWLYNKPAQSYVGHSLERSAQISRKMSIKTTNKLFRKPGKRCAAVIEMYQGVKTLVMEETQVKSCRR